MNRILPFGRRINYSTDVIQKGDRVTETNSSPFPRIDKFVAEFLKTRKVISNSFVDCPILFFSLFSALFTSLIFFLSILLFSRAQIVDI